MASPFGHSLVGLALGPSRPERTTRRWAWYAFCVVGANVPDLDFLPGLVLGDVNRFHHAQSHSFAAALLFGLVLSISVWLLSKGSARYGFGSFRVGLAATALYASHLVLDLLTHDPRAPFGQPLLWPVSSEYFVSPWTPFGGLLHGVPGDTVGEFLADVFSLHNATVLGVEFVLLAPLFAIGWWLARSRAPSATAVAGGYKSLPEEGATR